MGKLAATTEALEIKLNKAENQQAIVDEAYCNNEMEHNEYVKLYSKLERKIKKLNKQLVEIK